MSERRRANRAGFKPKKSVALSGVPAGNTALCTVGRTGNDLHYRGYDILDIADELRVRGDRLPADPRQAAERSGARRLQGEAASACAGCPAPCARRSSSCPPSTHPMDVMRTGVSVLGCALPEKDDHSAAGARDIADRLIACLGSMLVYWYHYSHSGQRIDVETDDDSIGGHFLHLLHRRAAARELGATRCTPR